MTSTLPTASQDIRGVLIQIEGARLLLPNATIAEVLSFADPEPVENSPDWLLGRIRWRGWLLPLIAFGRIAGLATEQGGLGSKVIVLKALGGDAKLPHFALLTQGFPRLVTVSRDTLSIDDTTSDALPNGVQARVLLNEDVALVPDLDQIESLIGQALAQAA
jgi:chemosensory pili system protein ChpC